MRSSPLAALSLVATLGAQHLVVYDPIGIGFLDQSAPNLLFAGPVPPAFIYPAIPPLLPVAPGPPFFLPPGDATIDGTTGMNWFTDGVVVGTTPTIAYPPAGPALPPFPIGVIGLALAGPVTGMALDPIGSVLWLTDGATIVATAPIPGTPLLAPPFVAPTPPLVGLEWDALTATLRAVDVGGVVWTLTPAGAIVPPPLPPPIAPPGLPADVCMDKTGLPGPVGLRPVYVLYPPGVLDMFTAMMLPGAPGAVGLSFHAYPGAVPPIGVCACPTFAHGIGIAGPMTAGNAGFGFTVTGLPAGQIVLHVFDFFFNPALPVINTVGCGLGMIIGSPTQAIGAAFAGPGGTAVYPLPLPLLPGFGPLFHQSGTLCPADPAGFVIQPLELLALCGT
jgi:hypothetical protein